MSRRKRKGRRGRRRGELLISAVDQAWDNPELFQEWLEQLASVESEPPRKPQEDLAVDYYLVDDGHDDLIDILSGPS